MKSLPFTIRVILPAALTINAVQADEQPANRSDALFAASSAHDWSGFYAGVHAGYGQGDMLFDFGSTDSITMTDGALGGLQAGWNHQFRNGFVAGLEADLAATGFEGADSCPSATFTCNIRANWMTSLRARLGYATGRALIFTTGGITAMNGDYKAVNIATGIPFAPKSDRTAFGPVVGAGVDFAVTANLSARMEYLFHAIRSADLKASTFGGPVNGDLDIHTVRLGINYHFGR